MLSDSATRDLAKKSQQGTSLPLQLSKAEGVGDKNKSEGVTSTGATSQGGEHLDQRLGGEAKVTKGLVTRENRLLQNDGTLRLYQRQRSKNVGAVIKGDLET